jgi:fructokinase
MSTIAVIGEAVADAIVQTGSGHPGELLMRVLPGGGPVNTAVALGRLGAQPQYLGRLAGGTIGELLRRHLLESNVDLAGCVEAAENPTLAIATVADDGKASFEFYVEGTADWQWSAAELGAWTGEGVAAIHAGSLALTQQPGAAVIEDLLRQVRDRMTVCVDPNVRLGLVPAEFYRQSLPRWARLADIFRVSDDDLAVMMPGRSIPEACDQLHADGVPLIVVTRGADGAYACLHGEPVTVPSPQITVVDTVGAGDTFTAGLLHWLHEAGALGGRLPALTSSDLADAMTFATELAAIVCQRAGADPPWANELIGLPSRVTAG